MKNIIHVDFNNSSLNGISNIANKENELVVSANKLVVQETNAFLELTTITNTIIKYSYESNVTIDKKYFNSVGNIKIRVISDEATSNYITIKCQSFVENDTLYCKKMSSTMYEFYLGNNSKDCLVEGNLTVVGNIECNDAKLIDIIHPIGSLFEFGTNVDPNNLPGFQGTVWKRFAPGQVTVGYNAGDVDFNGIGKVGGAKTFSNAHTHATGSHTLTIAQIPSHTHNYVQSNWSDEKAPFGSQTWTSPISAATSATGGGQSHNHGATGSAQSNQSLLQPYVVVSKWIRTA